MTGPQERTCWKVFVRVHERLPELALNHGDCIGADEEADILAHKLGMVRYIWPSNIEATRAHCEDNGAIVASPESAPIARDIWIVQSSAFMVAAPATSSPEKRSGTWATVRHAWRTGKRVFIVYPDGRLSRT